MSWFDETSWRLFVALASFLAAVHAYRKLSPFFAITWFGSGLVFGWFWTEQHAAPEALLLPVLVVYLAAAVTKGLVEQGRHAGNHALHVLITGVFAGLIALPLESSARAMGHLTPRGAARFTGAWLDGPWLGDANTDLLAQWMLVGLAFYGVYKLLDHAGLGRALQTLLLFGAMAVLPRGLDAAIDWIVR